MQLLSNEECKKVNKQTGLKYLALSNNYKNLVRKYEEHKSNPQKSVNWDFDRFIDIYSELQRRTEVIGNRLVQSV